MTKPSRNEYPEWYDGYIQSVPEGNILKLMKKQLKEITEFLNEIPASKETYCYAPGKWSIKEVLGHTNDAEKILAYRALRIIRQDKTDLPSYEHDDDIKAFDFNKIPFEDLKMEFRLIRKSNLFLFKNLNDSNWLSEGTVNGNKITVRALAYIIVGHAAHHLKILKEKYME